MQLLMQTLSCKSQSDDLSRSLEGRLKVANLLGLNYNINKTRGNTAHM